MRHQMNVVIMDEEVHFKTVPRFIKEVGQIISNGFEEIRIDFSDCPGAFADGMVPLVAQVDKLRRDGLVVTVILPKNDYLERLFLNTNWAHFLSPDEYNFNDAESFNNNYPLHRFSNSKEQASVVNGLLRIILKKLTLSRDMLQGLEWSFNEITDNVLNHAQVGGGLAQANWYPQSGKVQFVVADVGVGILASLREGFPNLKHDTEALEEAIKAGTTRNSQIGQGNGLAGTLRIATLTGGVFSIASGRGQLVIDANIQRPIVVDPTSAMQGTMVSATLVSQPESKMIEAFNFDPKPGEYTDYDMIDAHYTKDDALIIKLSEEAVSFGTRPAGKDLRTQFLNLLRAAPEQPLILDWSNVSVISSSFADETVAKLFVELGPIAFGLRVRNTKMEPLVRSLIEKAILQRVTQNTQNSG